MSRRVRYVLMGLGLLVFVLVVWFLVLSPIRGNISATNTAIEDQKTRYALAQSQLTQAKSTKQEGELNQARLLELAKMIPNDQELPSLLLQLQDLADQSGIDFVAITPGDPTAAGTGDYQLLPLSLTFAGTFFDVSDFTYRAEQMVAGPGRLLAIKSVNLVLGSTIAAVGSSPKLTATLSLYAFIMGVPAATVVPGSAGAASATTTTAPVK